MISRVVQQQEELVKEDARYFIAQLVDQYYVLFPRSISIACPVAIMFFLLMLSVLIGMSVSGDRRKGPKIDFGGGYLKIRTLGGGASAVAYEVTKGGKRYALKKAKSKGNILDREFGVLKEFFTDEGVPKAHELFKCRDGTDCLVLELVGPSLADLHKNSRTMDPLPIDTIGSIAIQLIDRMESVHRRGFVHGDLFGNNVSPGIGENKGIVYAIDFGQATRIRDPSARSKSFDAQSIVFTISNMLKHSRTRGILPEVSDLVKHVQIAKERGDKFLDYNYMRELMESLMGRVGKKYTGKVIWPTEILRRLP